MQLSSNFVLSVEANDMPLGTLSTWTDKSGTSNHLNTVNGVFPDIPTVITDSLGYKTVNFPVTGGLTAMWGINSYDQPTTITICMVTELRNLTFNQELFSHYGSADHLTLVNPNININVTPSHTVNASFSGLTTGKKIIIYRRSLTSYEVFINGVLFYSNTYPLPLMTGSGHPYILGRGSAGYTLDGTIYQYHICHEYLSNDSIKKLTRYCEFKSGIKI